VCAWPSFSWKRLPDSILCGHPLLQDFPWRSLCSTSVSFILCAWPSSGWKRSLPSGEYCSNPTWVWGCDLAHNLHVAMAIFQCHLTLFLYSECCISSIWV
jgi:hypothetical protein